MTQGIDKNDEGSGVKHLPIHTHKIYLLSYYFMSDTRSNRNNKLCL